MKPLQIAATCPIIIRNEKKVSVYITQVYGPINVQKQKRIENSSSKVKPRGFLLAESAAQ